MLNWEECPSIYSGKPKLIFLSEGECSPQLNRSADAMESGVFGSDEKRLGLLNVC